MQSCNRSYFVAICVLVGATCPEAFLNPTSAPMRSLPRHHSSRCGHRKLEIRAKVQPRMALLDVSDSDFNDLVLQSEVPTLVSFWASWCGPCRMIKPVLEDLDAEYDGKMKVAQINTDDNQGTATEYGIRSIPTLILFKGGERVDTIIGAVPKSTLEAKLAQKL
eukprot:CAMPEP_0202842578 /NCGR_PEP_ID=MMETSP1389-20130828/61848_1 /ASSEMBLY_ACC=CAM_ASM_000865 /TAXON_ID=302021 /ORGANISM="Rhodomonas sp., Strain CCMP768" /LENGTH=163 /DNA_ID=CAMNT_0049519585 /DNA_START=117 /DNA_END=608 /DNA_ORIENTATION=-